MFRLNNRGQSLVMFVVIIPIFLLIITLIYDVGNAIYEKNSTKRIKGVFGKMFNFNLTDVSCHYMGKMVLDKKVIERV